eukprot:10019710-Prorocentrum_lima.AAC.1
MDLGLACHFKKKEEEHPQETRRCETRDQDEDRVLSIAAGYASRETSTEDRPDDFCVDDDFY